MDTLAYNTIQKGIVQELASNIVQQGSENGYDIPSLLRCNQYMEKVEDIEHKLSSEKERKKFNRACTIVSGDLLLPRHTRKPAHVLRSNDIKHSEQVIKRTKMNLNQRQRDIERVSQRISKEFQGQISNNTSCCTESHYDEIIPNVI